MGRARFDVNNIHTLTGVSSSDGLTPIELWADPSTHALVTGATLTGTSIPSTGATTAVAVQIVDGSGNQITSFGGGTQYTNGGVPPANPIGPTLLFNNAGAWATVGSATPLPVTGSLTVGGTTDNSAFTAGTTTGTPAMGFYHSTIDTVTDGRSATFGMTSKRAMLVTLQTSAGADTGVAASPLQVSLANTAANATAIKVDGSAVTQPVSGTFWQATQPVSGTVTTTPPSNASTNIAQINGVTPLMGTGIMGTGSPRVTIASDNDPLTVKQATAGNLNATVVGTGTFAVQATLSAETTKVIGVTRTSDGAGNLITTNSTTPSGKFAIDQNIISILGTAPTTVGKLDVKGADGDVFVRQATGSNLHTVIDSGTLTTLTTLTGITNTVVTDDLAAAPTGAAVPANAMYTGALAQTALPTAASAGNLTGNMADKYGRQVVLPGAIRDLVGTQTTTIAASTSETTIVTAIASTFNDLTALVISNTSATATRVDLRDTTAGSVLFSIYVPAGDVRGVAFNRPIPQTSVNTNWTAQSSVSITDLRIYCAWDKNK